MLVLLLLAPTVALGDTNVALGKSVTLNGTFYVGGWGGIGGAPSTLVDGVFLPRATQWDHGSVWWNPSYGPQDIVVDLGGACNVNSLILQGDDNESYRVSYWDLGLSNWQTAWVAPDVPPPVGGLGLQTRPNPGDNTEKYVLGSPITTDKFKIEAASWDQYYSVSEFQAYGSPVPVPPTVLLLGSGLLGLVGWRRIRKS